MIIKFKEIIYLLFLYVDNKFEEVKSYKYLVYNVNCSLKWNNGVEKSIIGGRKAYYGLENKYRNVVQQIVVMETFKF